MPENNYIVQKDLVCCANCQENDQITNQYGEELICGLTKEFVDPIGICDLCVVKITE